MTTFIHGFFGEHRFLSNFWPAEVEYGGVLYPTSEHAFQASKFDDLEYRKEILAADSPGKAKKLGQTLEVPLREHWDEGLAAQAMSEILAYKFSHNPFLKKGLLETGEAILVETNTWGDDTWGDSTTTEKPGKNQLGIILMAIRASLR